MNDREDTGMPARRANPTRGYGATPASGTASYGAVTPSSGTGAYGASPAPSGTASYNAMTASTGSNAHGTTPASNGTGVYGTTPAPNGTGAYGSTPAPSGTGAYGATPAPSGTGAYGATPAPAGTGVHSATPAPSGTGAYGATPAPSGTGAYGATPAPSAAPTPRYVRQRAPHRSQGTLDDLNDDSMPSASYTHDSNISVGGATPLSGRAYRRARNNMNRVSNSRYGQYLEIPKGRRSIFASRERARRRNSVLALIVVIGLLVLAGMLIWTMMQNVLG